MISTKILVVDDQAVTQTLLERRLSAQGYIVSVAATGAEALRKVADESPALIIMDIMLPDIDGAEVVRMIQARAATAKIPVIFLSSIIGGEDGRAGSEVKIGEVIYTALGKPVDMDLLLRVVQAALSERH